MPAQSKAGLSVRFEHFTMCVEGSCLCNNSLPQLRKLQVKTFISVQGRIDMQEELRNLVS